MTDCPDCAERAKVAAAAGPPGVETGAPPGWQQPGAPPAWQQPPAPWQQPAAPWQQPPAAWQPPPPQQAAPPQAPPQAAGPPWQPPPSGPPPQQPQWAPAPVGYAPPAEPPRAAAPPYAPPPPQHPHYAQQPPAAWPPPEARSAPPAWLVGVGTAVAFLLLGAGIYYFMNHSDSSSPTTADKTAADSSGGAASKQKVTNPVQKYVEVMGIRMMTQDKEPVVRFLVVNHSGAEIVDLAANVTLLASTSRSDEDAVGTFSFKVPSLGSNEFKDLTAPLKTKLKPYELPDWQNTTAEIQITSPTQ